MSLRPATILDVDVHALARHLKDPVSFARSILATRELDDESLELRFAEPRWVIAASIEDSRSPFPESERITSRTIDELVETFDPEFRRVAWISGFVEGGPGRSMPSHWSVGPPIAEIREVSRDRINLWVLTAPIIDPDNGVDRFERSIAQGYTERSIGFLPGSPETGGRAQLIHVAALSMAEQPGIPNMPRMDRSQLEIFQRSRSVEIDQEQAAREWQHLGTSPSVDGLQLRSFAYIQQKAAEAEEEFKMELSEQALSQLGGLLERSQEPVLEQINALAARVTESEQRAADAEAAAEQARQDLADSQAQSEADTVAAEEERVAEEQRTLAERVQTAANEATRNGRMPSTVQSLAEALPEEGSLTEAHVNLFERSLATMPRQVRGRQVHEVQVNDTVVEIDPSTYTLMGDGSVQPLATELEALAELRAETGYDPKSHTKESFAKFRERVVQLDMAGALR